MNHVINNLKTNESVFTVLRVYQNEKGYKIDIQQDDTFYAEVPCDIYEFQHLADEDGCLEMKNKQFRFKDYKLVKA